LMSALPPPPRGVGGGGGGGGMNTIAFKTGLLVGRLIMDYQMNCGD